MVRTYGMDNKTSGSFNINGDTMKYFLIYSVAYFGDTLMTNSPVSYTDLTLPAKA